MSTLVSVPHFEVVVCLEQKIAGSCSPHHDGLPSNLSIGFHLELSTLQEGLPHVADDSLLRPEQIGGLEVSWRRRRSRSSTSDVSWELGRQLEIDQVVLGNALSLQVRAQVDNLSVANKLGYFSLGISLKFLRQKTLNLLLGVVFDETPL